MTLSDSTFLTSDCRYFDEKMFFFCIVEKWEQVTFSEEHNLLMRYFLQMKFTEERKYYLAIFHLLTCPFCLQRSSILQEKSHPELWKLIYIEEKNIPAILQKIDSNTPRNYYIKLLLRKLFTKENSVAFKLCHKDQEIQIQNWKVKAAGTHLGIPTTQKLDAAFFGEQEALLTFDHSVYDESICISLQGVRQKMRLRCNLRVNFHNGTQEEFFGKALEHGGSWLLKMNRRKIKSIELNFWD
ncbi:hypothetical protein [Candidatus Uabimicrobium amorphum]|uniref:Uncharacterized protein n=1 Tax=Uabimicrobium amorphum TaxID=2596890 RepID=A0A5S9IMK4_UABAM|nr:hypothetical protein [Candidatus Uabimicrobium amorphum]BBM84196.1 hypothetical protein UABAM_02552 [Candidatus Uabimicrobium amorphum]